ncbi:MAG: hypothetical protein AB1938_28675 [Myxococcota bacterium]
MRTFRVKAGVTLKPNAVPPHLADPAAHRTFPLTSTEVEVAKCVLAGRPDDALDSMSRKQVAAILARLVAAGYLETEGVPTPQPVPEAPPADRRPRLRTDLTFVKAPRPGHTEVRDLRAGKSFTFYEFELTIARMFDGKHTLAQVAAAAERIGLKTTTETLASFVRQLDSLGLLTSDSHASGPPTPRPPPPSGVAWSPELKEMYKFALGHARAGQYPEAARYLEELLAIEPTLKEARTLLDDVRACAEGQRAGVDFLSLHGAPPPPPTIPPVVAAPAPAVEPTAHVVRPSQWSVSEVLKSLDLPDPGTLPRAAGRK